MSSSNPGSEVLSQTRSTVQDTPLIDLHNELWLIVMEHLGPPELYVLGRTSRHLNSLLCEFLWHTHFPRDPDDQGMIGINLDLTIDVVARRWWRSPYEPVGVVSQTDKRNRSIDDLDLLSTVLKPQPIHKLTCKFDNLNTSADKPFIPDQNLIFPYLFEDYQQLSRFLSRLSPGLAHVNIELGPDGSQSRGTVPLEVWLARTKILNELFNVCIQKGCSSFHVSGSYTLAGITVQISPRHLRWGNLVDMAIGKKPSLASIFSKKTTRIGVGWRISTVEKLKGGLNPPSLMIANETIKEKMKNKPNHSGEIVQSRLTSFTIDYAFLVIPPFSNWTYQLVATSPLLTTLTLSNLDDLEPSFLEVVLTWLLEALKIQNALKSLTIKSGGASDSCGILHMRPLLWFIHELGQARGAASSSSPMALEELNFVGWRFVDMARVVPNQLHKSFNGRATSQTLKRMNLHCWVIVLALVGLNAREEYTSEMEATVMELVKERFTALERMEFGVNPDLHIVKVIPRGTI